jgi:hypothetical protein
MAARSGTRPPSPSPQTSLQGGRGSYYSQGGTRTATFQGRGGTYMAGTAPGRQVRYQSPSGQRVSARVPGLPPGTYHRIVLAEFAACVILVGASPVLTPRTKQSGTAEIVDATASLAAPLVRLTAVCVVFFVLALMATGPRSGKAAAAFGGLVLLGTLLNATDMLGALGKALGPGKAAAAAAAGSTAAEGTAPAAAEGTAPAAGEGTLGPAAGGP